MNRYNFLQTGGFPLETDTLEGMQNAYSIFNALGHLAGNLTIISGCVVSGSNVSNGVVFINGELYRFVGGNAQSDVRILIDTTTKVWEDGNENDWEYDRYVSFASGQDSLQWQDFTRLENIKNIQSRILPAGTNPQMYTGSLNAIPTGWQLCNGTNGTPDLRGRFIVGFDQDKPDYDDIGNTGGLEEVELTIGQLPQHNFEGITSSGGSHSHTVNTSETHDGAGKFAGGGAASEPSTLSTNSAGSHNHNFSTDSVGNDEAHENRPPYYTLAFIIYTG